MSRNGINNSSNNNDNNNNNNKNIRQNTTDSDENNNGSKSSTRNHHHSTRQQVEWSLCVSPTSILNNTVNDSPGSSDNEATETASSSAPLACLSGAVAAKRNQSTSERMQREHMALHQQAQQRQRQLHPLHQQQQQVQQKQHHQQQQQQQLAAASKASKMAAAAAAAAAADNLTSSTSSDPSTADDLHQLAVAQRHHPHHHHHHHTIGHTHNRHNQNNNQSSSFALTAGARAAAAAAAANAAKNGQTNAAAGGRFLLGVLFTLVELILFVCLFLWLYWSYQHDDGLAWQNDRKQQFNLHAALMLFGFIFLSGQAMLIHRSFQCCNRIYTKIMHTILFVLATSAISLALMLAYTAQENVAPNNKPIMHFYSLHAWCGLVTVILFALQFTLGFISFLILLCCDQATASFRSALLPIHKTFGLIIFDLAIATCLMGLLQTARSRLSSKLNKIDYHELAEPGIVINAIGVCLILLAILMPYIIRNLDIKPRYGAHAFDQQQQQQQHSSHNAATNALGAHMGLAKTTAWTEKNHAHLCAYNDC